MATTTTHTSYDEVPYESHAFSQTHPDRLAVVATLLGLKPGPTQRCAVLELGCAAAGNIAPMALGLPESRFVGIDASRVQVADGEATVQNLRLTNLRLAVASILDVTPDFGKFDYIICHGVYSWVPSAVQDKILEICSRNLNPNGIAYVSYNTYPGWHMRGMIRDMLYYHARQFVEPAMKVKQARNLLDFLAKAVGKEEGPYSLLLRGELESFHRSSDSYLYHEHLEEHNEPIYFYQFAERAAAKGLRYLAEVDLRVMVPSNYPPEIQSVLQMVSQDHIHLEQYMDFLRNRMFRQTLLCHKHLTPNYSLRGEQLKAFHVASPAKPKVSPQPDPSRRGKGAIDVRSTEVDVFETPQGITLNSREPLVKAAMLVLGEAWPQAVPFAELLRQARAKLESKAPEAEDAQALGQALLTFYAQASTSLVELWLNPPKFTMRISAKPTASPLARLQAATKNRVTNLRHESVFLGEFERRLVRPLDGAHDRCALVTEIIELVEKGELTVEKDGQPIKEGVQLRELIADAVDRQLKTIASNALLVA